MDIFSNIGSGELIFIFIIILLVMGPQRLPEIARVVAQALRKVQEAYQELSSEFAAELKSAEEATKEVRESIETIKEVADLPKTLLKTTVQAVTEETPEPLDVSPTDEPNPSEGNAEDGPADE